MAKPSKTVLLATDGRINIQVDALAKALNLVCKHIKFASRAEPIDLGKGPVSDPATYKRIAGVTTPLLDEHSLVLIATDVPYDNNYFWDSDGNVVVVSYWGWEFLTNLPKANGLVGFVDSILAQDLDPTVRHDVNTGCAYDILWDKRGVDARLRSGVVCRDCYARVRAIAERNPQQRLRLFDCTIAEGLEDLTTVLDEVSQASKREVDILTRWQTKAGVSQDFDVFLCHNSQDKPSIRRLYQGLKDRGLSPWLDEEHARPGIPWQKELENAIPRIRSAAVVVGPHGQGPWQELECYAFISEFLRRACPVIPILLADARDTPELPLLLRPFTYIDFRSTIPDPWRRLVWGISGSQPRVLAGH
jgi:hypothetical protein